jgi:hypothetical protein
MKAGLRKTMGALSEQLAKFGLKVVNNQIEWVRVFPLAKKKKGMDKLECYSIYANVFRDNGAIIDQPPVSCLAVQQS